MIKNHFIAFFIAILTLFCYYLFEYIYKIIYVFDIFLGGDKVQGVQTMEKTKRSEYTVSDAVKFILCAILLSVAVSLVYSVVLISVSARMGVGVEVLQKYKAVSIISCLINPVCFFVMFLIFNATRKVKGASAVNLNGKFTLLPFSVVIMMALICILLISPIINMIFFGFEKLGYVVDDSLPIAINSPVDLVVSILILALVPAIVEELVYRGVILNGFLSKMKPYSAVVLSALIFAVMHGSLQQFLYQFILGMCLGLIMLYSENIWFPMLLHFLNNALVVILSTFNPIMYLNTENVYYDNFFQILFPILMFILGVGLIAVLLFMMHYFAGLLKHYPKAIAEKSYNVVNEKGNIIQKEKTNIFGIIKTMSANEKVIYITSIALMLIIWIANTISGFVG